MSEKRHRIGLSEEDHQILVKLINTGKEKARKITRARILLLSDDGPYGKAKTDEQIAEALREFCGLDSPTILPGWDGKSLERQGAFGTAATLIGQTGSTVDSSGLFETTGGT